MASPLILIISTAAVYKEPYYDRAVSRLPQTEHAMEECPANGVLTKIKWGFAIVMWYEWQIIVNIYQWAYKNMVTKSAVFKPLSTWAKPNIWKYSGQPRPS